MLPNSFSSSEVKRDLGGELSGDLEGIEEL
jgi:hypothetical protein